MFFSTIQVINPNVEYQNYECKSYILIDGYNGDILEGKNFHDKRSVASISKIMTAILAIESEKLFYSFAINSTACNIEGSSIYLKENEEYRLIDLVYGLLLRSGNDASYAISEIVEKNTSLFVEKMNQKAQELQMKNTYFSNPCGLDIYDDGNISTAYDMAILMKYCMNNELFKEIISTKEYRFDNHLYINKNKLLKTYKYLIGGKTGYTSKAKRTLITAGEKDNQYLIMVSLACSNDYNFHKAIYETYFNRYKYIIFLNKGKNYINQYIFLTDKIIGMRISINIEKGIKKYYYNQITNELTISFIDTNKVEYAGGKYSRILIVNNF